MRGTVCKAIRRVVYGDFSQRRESRTYSFINKVRKFFIGKDGKRKEVLHQQVINDPKTLRFNYQQTKKSYKRGEFGIVIRKRAKQA